MAEIALPWFFALEHLPNSGGGALMAGDGAFTYATASTSNLTVRSGHRVALFSGTGSRADRTIPASTALAVGCRVEASSAAAGIVIEFRTGDGSNVITLWKQSGDALEVRRGGTTLGVSGQNVTTMRYVECCVKLVGAGADSFTLRVDGAEALALTGLSLGSSPVEMVRFGPSSINGGTYQTHWYIRDASGLENPFYGPILPRWLPVSTDVGAVQWARNAGTSNAGRLRDYPAGSDLATTYVETQTLGHKDEYTVDDLPPDVNSIIAVVPFAVSTAPSGGAPQLRLGVKTSAGETAGPERTVGISAYQTQCGQALTQKPGGGGWSRAAVNEINLTLEAA